MGNTWRELRPFMRLFCRHWKWMALGTLLGLISAASAAGLLALSGWFISATAVSGLSVAAAQLFNFFYPSIGVRLFAIGRTLSRYAERVVCHDVTFKILGNLRSWFYHHIEPLAPSCLLKFRSGDMLNRIVADIDALDNLYLRVLSPSVIALSMSLLVVGFLWIFDPGIAVAVLLFLVVAGIAVPVLAFSLGEAAGRDMAHRFSDLRIQTVDGLQGLAELLVFDASEIHLGSIQASSRKLLSNQLRMSHIRGLSMGLITLTSGLAVLAALYLGVQRISQNLLEGADLALVALVVLAVFDALLPLPSAYQHLGHTRESGRRLTELVDIKPEVKFFTQSSANIRRFNLDYQNVSFRYHERGPWALRDVRFQVPHGHRVAVIGETGCGKSTLIHLLVRFWDPISGHIRIGNHRVSNLSESDLRRTITMVAQQPHMFNATLKENLLLAKPGATDDELYVALDSAQLLEFVNSLPDGLNTWIGEAGRRLSGGEIRRVAVARAILHNAPVWVMDEPTEGLDAVTERSLMQALRELTAGRTFLMVTHRLIDLYWMNHIVMLERGRVIAQGSHQHLLKTNRRYVALHARIG